MEDHLPCPRCGATLADHDLATVEIEACDSCRGILVEQKNLIPLLDALAKVAGDKIDPESVPETVPDDNPVMACPDCTKPMIRFGYMESRTVTLDRCSKCWLVWIDDGELPTLVHMHARITGQATAQAAARDELAEHLSRLVWVSNTDRGGWLL